MEHSTLIDFEKYISVKIILHLAIGINIPSASITFISTLFYIKALIKDLADDRRQIPPLILGKFKSLN